MGSAGMLAYNHPLFNLRRSAFCLLGAQRLLGKYQMSTYTVDPGVKEAIAGFSNPPRLGFGTVKAPAMFIASYEDGGWEPGHLQVYQPIPLDPAAKSLHYAQQIFEGLKAYKVDQPRPNFFRPLKNLQRLNTSARRLCMPEVPQDLFMQGIGLVTAWNDPFIPTRSGTSLYLRPFMLGTTGALGMAPADSYLFMVIASPVEAYHSGEMRVLVERDACRSSLGGTGAAKCGGNYAAAMLSARQTQSRGFHQSLWLDPRHMKYVEELSGMNVFAVIDGELHTPELSGTFLPGITRDSLLELGRRLGYPLVERPIPVDELLADIRAGRCTEAFACGTAAIISPISVIADVDGSSYELSDVDQVAGRLRNALLDIQERRAEDPFDWVVELDPVYYPG